MDGFFVAKLQKTSDEIPKHADEETEPEEEEAADETEEAAVTKKPKVDKRDWFHKDLKEINKKQQPEKKETYITKVFEQPIKKKFDKSKKKTNGTAINVSQDEPAVKKTKTEEVPTQKQKKAKETPAQKKVKTGK